MIAVSVAHSSKAPGAVSADGLTEYAVSVRASRACAESLQAQGLPCTLIDIGPLGPKAYIRKKLQLVNALKPELAIEIHCNSSKNKEANYFEVIHHPASKIGVLAAKSIASVFELGFANRHGWKSNRGFLPDDRRLFFIDDCHCPSLIVEGLFLSNDEQAKWLASPGGAEAYGMMVAEGILNWKKL